MKVRDLMTPNPRTLQADASLGDAVELMAGYRIRHLPILENDRVVGIVSERDVKMALGPDSAHLDLAAVDPRQADGSISWFMSDAVLVVDADADITVACELFIDRRVGALGVTDDGKLVGILSVVDILKAALADWQASD